ncbi:MAG: hypothetical protein R2828_35745 [Saprospiraceae bacterium]
MIETLTTTDFPVIWLNDNELSIGAFRNQDELTTCTRGVTKPGGFYDHLRLISTTEKEFTVTRVNVLGYKKPKSISNIFWRLINADLVIVELKLKYIGSAKVEAVKIEMINMLNKNAERWDSDGNLSKLLQMIEVAKSTKELVTIMTKRYYYELF